MIAKTEIYLNAALVGGTEQETQAVIDALQQWGWNVVWGDGPSRFCDAAEEGAFQADFFAAVEECTGHNGNLADGLKIAVAALRQYAAGRTWRHIATDALEELERRGLVEAQDG